MMKTYYLPINSSNLGSYYCSALIVPQKFIADPINDLQSDNSDMLLLSKLPVQDRTDCNIKLLLTEKEATSLLPSNDKDIVFYNACLPITRVLSIEFSDEVLMKNTLTLASSSSFIPEHLVVVNKLKQKLLSSSNVENKHTPKDQSSLIKKYDAFLGAFAFMRYGGNMFSNYSPRYFSILSKLNTCFNQEYDRSNDKPMVENDYSSFFKLDEKVKGFIDRLNLPTRELQVFLSDKVENSNNLFKLDRIKSKSHYIYAILANYGPGAATPKSIESLLLDLLNSKFCEEYKELITLSFGWHNGYKKFAKSYYVDEKRKDLKFKLDSKLDYYTIEALFAYVFESRTDVELSYLDEYIRERQQEKSSGFYSYEMFGSEIIYAKKPDSIKELLTKSVKKINLKDFTTRLIQKDEKNIGVEFNDQQKEELSKNYEAFISEPIMNYCQDLSDKAEEYYLDKTSELNAQIKTLNEKLNNQSLLIQKQDKTLFDEIDTNGDGILSSEELSEFFNRLTIAHKDAVLGLEDDINTVPIPIEMEKETGSDLDAEGSNLIQLPADQLKVILSKTSLSGLKSLCKDSGLAPSKVNKDNRSEYESELLELLKH